MPPTSLSWMRHDGASGKAVYYQLENLDATSLDVIAHWLLAAPSWYHTLLLQMVLLLGNFDEHHLDTVPCIIPFLKTVGSLLDELQLDVTWSLARRLSLPRCPSLFTYNRDLGDLTLTIHVQESMSYEWLLKVISHLRTPEGPAIEYLRIDFIIDVHLSNGAVVPEGPECKGCALHPMPTRPLTGPGVLDDIMASLKTVCDVLDRALWNIRDIQICCCAQLDAGIWMPRLRTWLPQSRQSKALMYNYL
ncbi:hypothetical protein IEO21_09468 [Rhodonia placenta]|uniref:Uncharacterized protein n=1 Tax=Rhodonia placenta TaxID=104341 RepID=A0A8H7TY71_9APHY|nr:hypothetical protein IEO21_09468 [Postia placenta]